MVYGYCKFPKGLEMGNIGTSTISRLISEETDDICNQDTACPCAHWQLPSEWLDLGKS